MKRGVPVCLVAAVLATLLIPPTFGAGVGLKLGFSLSKLAQKEPDSSAFDWKNIPFIAVGLTFERRWGHFSIQPEALFVRLGGKYVIDAANSLENRFDYIQVPVLLKLDIHPNGHVDPFVCGGGYASCLIKARAILEVDGEKTKADVTDNYKRLDYGVVAGAGLTFRFPGLAIALEGRYGHGLANVYKDPAPGESLKNRTLMVLVTIIY